MKKILSITIIIIAALYVFYPMAKNTLFMAGDAYGLIMTLQMDDEDLSYNPFNKDASIVRPSMAIWILKNMDYPYTTCSFAGRVVNQCGKPIIMAAGETLGMKNKNNDEILLEIIRHMIDRGEPLNNRYKGMTCVHEAILYNKPEYLSVLLSAGADPNIRIEKEGTEYNGFNGFELYSKLESKKPGSRKEVGEILTQYEPKNV
jgi:hypothetical protein